MEGEEEWLEEVEEETVGKEGSALRGGSTSLGAVRILTLATAASPKRSSSPGDFFPILSNEHHNNQTNCSLEKK